MRGAGRGRRPLRVSARQRLGDGSQVGDARWPAPAAVPRLSMSRAPMPAARAVSRFATRSSTRTASAGAAPSRSSASRRMAGSGFIVPTSNDRTAASTARSRPVASSTSRACQEQLLTMASRRPSRRSAASAGRTSSKSATPRRQAPGLQPDQLAEQVIRGRRAGAARDEPPQLVERSAHLPPAARLPAGGPGPEQAVGVDAGPLGDPPPAGRHRLPVDPRQRVVEVEQDDHQDAARRCRRGRPPRAAGVTPPGTSPAPRCAAAGSPAPRPCTGRRARCASGRRTSGRHSPRRRRRRTGCPSRRR